MTVFPNPSHIKQSNPLGLTEWGRGWEHVDVACRKGFPFVPGIPIGGLTLMSLFRLGKKRQKPHRPKSLSLYQRFRTPFDQTTHKRKTHLKNRFSTQTNVQNNEHLLKDKTLITNWVASNFNHAFHSNKIVFIYVPERSGCPVDHVEVQQTCNVQLNRKASAGGLNTTSGTQLIFLAFVKSVCIFARIIIVCSSSILFAKSVQGRYVALRYLRWTFIDIIDH